MDGEVNTETGLKPIEDDFITSGVDVDGDTTANAVIDPELAVGSNVAVIAVVFVVVGGIVVFVAAVVVGGIVVFVAVVVVGGIVVFVAVVGVFAAAAVVVVVVVVVEAPIASCTTIIAICRNLTSMAMGKPYMGITPENEKIPTFSTLNCTLTFPLKAIPRPMQ